MERGPTLWNSGSASLAMSESPSPLVMVLLLITVLILSRTRFPKNFMEEGELARQTNQGKETGDYLIQSDTGAAFIRLAPTERLLGFAGNEIGVGSEAVEITQGCQAIHRR